MNKVEIDITAGVSFVRINDHTVLSSGNIFEIKVNGDNLAISLITTRRVLCSGNYQDYYVKNLNSGVVSAPQASAAALSVVILTLLNQMS